MNRAATDQVRALRLPGVAVSPTCGDASDPHSSPGADTATVLCGDMREVLRGMPAESVHAIVSDPPYGLEFMGKAWDQQVPGPDYWREVLRVAKPGAHLLAFGGTRTAHRLACALEDAGWEIRDCLSWLYGSGFPKSHDISKAIDRELGAERESVRPNPNHRPVSGVEYEGVYAGGNTGGPSITAPATEAARAWDGWGTALKPAWEPIYVCRKPFKQSVACNVMEHGCGGLNVDGCRITSGADHAAKCASVVGLDSNRNGSVYGESWGARGDSHSPLGRWPANLVLDEEAAALLDAQTGELGKSSGGRIHSGVTGRSGIYGTDQRLQVGDPGFGDSGGASRFFYVAKASRSEREAGLERYEPRNVNDGRDTSIDNAYQRGDTQRRNTHPTVKPISLMRWLVRLITPPGGTVLDPFLGSGSTGVAAVIEGARFIGVELSPEFAELARKRIAHAADEDEGEQLPLFGERLLQEPRAVARPRRQLSIFEMEPAE